jgi:hypothetical protein
MGRDAARIGRAADRRLASVHANDQFASLPGKHPEPHSGLMPKKALSHAQRASMGGYARAENLTLRELQASSAKANRARTRKVSAARRKGIAQKAALARWGKKAP